MTPTSAVHVAAQASPAVKASFAMERPAATKGPISPPVSRPGVLACLPTFLTAGAPGPLGLKKGQHGPTAFSIRQRRKTLQNNLAASFGHRAAGRLIEAAGLLPGMRPEEVTVDGFVTLDGRIAPAFLVRATETAPDDYVMFELASGQTTLVDLDVSGGDILIQDDAILVEQIGQLRRQVAQKRRRCAGGGCGIACHHKAFPVIHERQAVSGTQGKNR